MAILLDTHAFLWHLHGDPRMSRTARTRIEDPAERVLVSVVSAWEIVIKAGTGKLVLAEPIEDFWGVGLASNNFEALNVMVDHVFAVSPLPLHHGDPFDRLLIAQAIANGLEIVSRDRAFDRYPVTRVW